jgi:hypothetical protein
MRGDRGQALVELLAGLPLVVALGLVLLQLLASGYAAVLAGSAAEAGAIALAGGGGGARAAAARSLPDWSRRRAVVEVRDDFVRVRLRPPSPIDAVAERLEVVATAAVELGGP